jgi:transposase
MTLCLRDVSSGGDKGLAGPRLLAYIVTSKYSDYLLPLYRLEDIFARRGFEVSRATQSVWCGNLANHLMADRVRAPACGG